MNKRKAIFILVFLVTHILLYIALFQLLKDKIDAHRLDLAQYIALAGVLLSAVLWACMTYQVKLIVKCSGIDTARKLVGSQFAIWYVLFIVYGVVIYLLCEHMTIYGNLIFAIAYLGDFFIYEITLFKLLKRNT